MNSGQLPTDIGDVSEDGLDWRDKGMPPGQAIALAELSQQGWNILAGDAGSPVAVLRQSALARNLATMRDFCEEHGVEIAPHAKTHMSPQLVARQLAAGAWGMTAAVPHQVAVLLRFGVRRVLVANEITDRAGLAWVAGRLLEDPELDILWYVDSVAGVRLAAAAMSALPGNRNPARLLLEVGHPDGRSGVRSRDDALAVAGAVAESPGLALAGVAGFEGTVGHDRTPATRERVANFLTAVRDTFVALDDAGLLTPEERVVTAGGSAFFDQVTDMLTPLRDRGAVVVLRSGCYLTHDNGYYEQVSPDVDPQWRGDEFDAAIEVWGGVLSRPEPDLALLNLGRRDVSFDMGLPTPLWTARNGRRSPANGLSVTALADQHAWLEVPAGHDLAVGDLVGVGVSHPCLTFDKWRLLMLVDDDYHVVGGIRTYF
jgi:D-serine deaminase-like pyridoxal phosphate-dependent protein